MSKLDTTLKVSYELRKRLMQLKLDWGLKSVEQVIEKLLEKAKA